MAKKIKPPALPKSPKPRSFHTKVVGVTFDNPDGTNRQSLVASCSPGQKLLLVREPKNKHDKHAIAVYAAGGWFTSAKQLGHLSRDLARQFAGDMDAGQTITATVSEVTGGGMLWWKKEYGLNIELTIMP